MSKNVDHITKTRLTSSKVSTVISISLVLYITGLLGIVWINARSISANVRENIGFEIMLSSTVSERELSDLQKKLLTLPYVKEIHYVSKEEATQETIEILGHDFREIVGNILPASIQLKIHSEYTSLDSLQKIEKSLYLMEDFITNVHYQKSYVNNINENLYKIGLVLVIVSGILLIIAIALISNTIRLSIYSKRFIIRSMLLVGAKKSTIYAPFIITGIVQGLWGSIIALLLLSGMLYLGYTGPTFSQIIDFTQPMRYIYLFIFIVIFGIFITWVSTFFSVGKYIKIKLDKLYI
ncbi:MAG: permease-like cell division protein FtsX [Bacteroidales bacterium]|jgi:cell division transport system permease protein|nr:permease-like cell division protein FtsX [Bacteroidales bacterium]